MNVNIRPAAVEDAVEIANLLRKSVTVLIADYSREQVEAIADIFNADFYREEISDRHRFILVAEAEKIVGFGSISQDGRAIADLFVLPDYTRQGIATLLLSELERVALEKGTAKLWVTAILTAKPFYESCGFKYEKDSALIDSETGIRIPFVDLSKILAGDRNFQNKNLGDYGDLSTLTVPQFIRLGVKILLGSSA